MVGKKKLDKGSQKLHISSYKINRNVMYNMINRISTPVYYIWKLLRE